MQWYDQAAQPQNMTILNPFFQNDLPSNQALIPKLRRVVIKGGGGAGNFGKGTERR